MSNRYVFIIISLLGLFALNSVFSQTRDQHKIKIFTSIPPMQNIIEHIAGPNAEIHVLIEPGKSPHTFEPSPRQMISLADANLYITCGFPFEQRMIEKIGKSYRNLVFIYADEGIDRGNEIEHADHHRHHLHNHDPHIWMSPEFLRIMAENIYKGLLENDPAGKKFYQTNYEIFLSDIRVVDSILTDLLKPYRGKSFLVYHPAFGHFADYYGLNQVSVEVEGKAPSPSQISEFIEKAGHANIKAIFIQPQFDKKSAEIIANSINGYVVVLDPLERNVLQNFKKVAHAIIEIYSNGE